MISKKELFTILDKRAEYLMMESDDPKERSIRLTEIKTFRDQINSLPDDQPDLLPFQWPIPDGMEVVTRDGRKVEQLTRFEGVNDYPLVGVIEGNTSTCCWFNDGKYVWEKSNNLDLDLFLRRKEKKVWVVEDGNENSLMAMYLHQKSHINKWLASNPGAKLYEATLKPVV